MENARSLLGLSPTSHDTTERLHPANQRPTHHHHPQTPYPQTSLPLSPHLPVH